MHKGVRDKILIADQRTNENENEKRAPTSKGIYSNICRSKYYSILLRLYKTPCNRGPGYDTEVRGVEFVAEWEILFIQVQPSARFYMFVYTYLFNYRKTG